jgi:hypothetical protein
LRASIIEEESVNTAKQKRAAASTLFTSCHYGFGTTSAPTLLFKVIFRRLLRSLSVFSLPMQLSSSSATSPWLIFNFKLSVYDTTPAEPSTFGAMFDPALSPSF